MREENNIHIYGEDNIDPAAIHQFYEAMKQDFSVKGALMPDSHKGYSLPIGGVVATEGVILPSWIGFDEGCGMCAVLTTYSRSDIEDNAKNIFQKIYDLVPVGFKHRKSPITWKDAPGMSAVVEEIYMDKGGDYQLGTLGGGKVLASRPFIVR